MTYMGSWGLSLHVRAQATLQIANIALEMLTLWDLHNLSIFFVRSSSKATVGTIVFRSFPERFGKEWPPWKTLRLASKSPHYFRGLLTTALSWLFMKSTRDVTWWNLPSGPGGNRSSKAVGRDISWLEWMSEYTSSESVKAHKELATKADPPLLFQQVMQFIGFFLRWQHCEEVIRELMKSHSIPHKMRRAYQEIIICPVFFTDCWPFLLLIQLLRQDETR